MWTIPELEPDFPTPSLIVHGPTAERNIQAMAEYCRQHDLDLRPHTKTHKSLLVAKMQMSAGAVGLTVAKVGEAQVMAKESQNILIAYPAIGGPRPRMVAELAQSQDVSVGIDSPEAIQQLSEAVSRAGVSIGVLIDIDVGFHRTGIDNDAQFWELAEAAERSPGIRLKGLMCFPGHLNSSSPADQWQEYGDRLRNFAEKWSSKGWGEPIVSGGSTPTATLSHLANALTEIRPGTYVYNDMNEVRLGVASFDNCAARVRCTVVSRAVAGKFVVDAGTKMLTSDRCGPALESGFGYVVEYPDAKVVRLSEEHGEVQLLDGVKVPEVGSNVSIIPNHICPCVNLQDSMWWVDDQGGVSKLPIDARGMVV